MNAKSVASGGLDLQPFKERLREWHRECGDSPHPALAYEFLRFDAPVLIEEIERLQREARH